MNQTLVVKMVAAQLCLKTKPMNISQGQNKHR